MLNRIAYIYWLFKSWNVAQAGSASRSGRGDRRFESSHHGHFFVKYQELTCLKYTLWGAYACMAIAALSHPPGEGRFFSVGKLVNFRILVRMKTKDFKMLLYKKAVFAMTLGLSVSLIPVSAKAFNGVFAPKKIGAQLVHSVDYTLVQGYRDNRAEGHIGADNEAHRQHMPPEVKEKIHQKIEDRFGHLTPVQRAEKLEELRQRREELRRELESLPPAERKARMEELKEQFRQKNKDTIH